MRTLRAELVRDEEHAQKVVAGIVLGATRSLFMATANAKDLRVPAPIGTRARAKGAYVSLVELLAGKVAAGLELRFLHAGLPSRPFRAVLAAHPRLASSVRACPRVHLKMIAADGEKLYLGSANFTGAGLGEKSDGRRNFELGIVTSDEVLLDTTQARFDRIWRGLECAGCKLRRECPRPLDLVESEARARRAAARAPSVAAPARGAPAGPPSVDEPSARPARRTSPAAANPPARRAVAAASATGTSRRKRAPAR